MNKTGSNLLMFILGFCFYCAIEVIFRDMTFRLMGVAGGLIFTLGGTLNDKFSWKLDLLLQCGIISGMVTLLEAIVGNIDYYFLHLNMWDYSNLHYQYFNGKISLLFSIIWFFMGFAVIFVHDAITYYWLHEGEQPEYWIFKKKIWQMPIRKCETH